MQTTDFGKEVKKRLVDLEKTQLWLCGEVTSRTGLYLDIPYLNRIFAGVRKPQRIIKAIREVLDLPPEEEE